MLVKKTNGVVTGSRLSKALANLTGGAVDRRTWQSVSTNMGTSFGPLINISKQIHGGVPKGLWQRARLYKESNPYFQHNNPLNYAKGEGRLWGFGIHSNGGGYTRKPVVYWSDDNGNSWQGPELLHGPMFPGTDTGYGDLKRRTDNTFVAATYYCGKGPQAADVEQYTFGGPRAKIMVEVDQEGDGAPDNSCDWRELHDGTNLLAASDLLAAHWRLKLLLSAPEFAAPPKIHLFKIISK